MSLLALERVTVTLPVGGLRRPVLRDVTLELAEGEAVGLVGESGSGKSMTARAIARLLPPGAELSGSIVFDGRDVCSLAGATLRRYRAEIACVFQDPRAHVNPVHRIEDFMGEALVVAHGLSRAEARRRAVAALAEVGIDDPGRRLRQYPHELSGGMLQRVMIATALLSDPRLLLADEPTTALDVVTQSEVMAILDELRRVRGLTLLFITHDLELAGAVCDRTVVMYAGEVVEERPSGVLHEDPLHPYTAALVAARPDIGSTAERLAAIPGRPLSSFEAPAAACAFAPRCAFAEARCTASRPAVERLADGAVRCVRAAELRHKVLAAQVHG